MSGRNKTKAVGRGYLDPGNMLFKKYNAAMSVYDGYFSSCSEELKKAVKKTVADKFYKSLLGFDGLTKCDEGMAKCLNELMCSYDAAISEYESSKCFMITSRVADMTDGIVNVLKLRKEAFTKFSRSQSFEEALASNPVAMEKKELTAAGLRKLDSELENILVRAFADCRHVKRTELSKLTVNGLDYDGFIGFFEQYLSDITEGCINNIADVYETAERETLRSLNEPSERTETSELLALLKEEHGVLKSIVTLQSAAVAFNLDAESCGEDERRTAETLTSAVASFADSFEEKAGAAITLYERAAEKYEHHGIIIDAVSADELRDTLRDNLSSAIVISRSSFNEFYKEFDLRMSVFRQTFREEIALPEYNRYKTLAPKKLVYGLKKNISEAKSLTDDVIYVFSKMCLYCAENKTMLSASPNYEIINGIAETVEIKIQSMKESEEQFSEDAYSALKMLSEEGEAANEAECAEFCSECEKAVFECTSGFSKDDRRLIMLFKRLYSDFDSDEIAVRALAKTEKGLRSRAENVGKRIFRYKKESLFYELSTFEEIMHYSVSRLITLNAPEDAGFISFITTEHEFLASLIRRYGIEEIKPRPHDMWNGKEHEVLIAEKDEAFCKGEIIKLMNTGYKEGDTVIIRANVVACK